MRGANLKKLFIRRICNIFETVIDNRVDVLVLGAFGCGAFKNPPDVVADAFKFVLSSNRYSYAFNKVVFAVKGGGENAEVFRKTFLK